MASGATSIRYGGAASVGGTADALNRILADLCTRGTPKDGAAVSLKKHVEEAARDLGGEAFSRCMDQFYDKIANLLESNEVADNLGALRAINELIDVSLGESASKVSKLSSYMRTLFEVKRDPEVLVLASEVLGHLVRAGGAMTADEVERQIKNALDWLHGERIEYRRFAAVLILKEMAENASTVFNVHVPEFVDAIWVALRDPTLAVRERTVEALRACLRVIEKRETRWRVQWYYRMCEAAQVGLGKNASVHSIHGSLLAVGELLRNTGEFMMSRYREVADIVLKYLEHRDRLVRLSITSLLPRIAHFLRDRFVTNYLKICMDHILAVLRIPAERASGFIALGEMAGALDGELIPYLPTITLHLRDAIAPRRGRPSLEALACIGSFAKAMGPAMEPHVRGLLDSMFSAGLSTNLVVALEQITVSIPSLLPTIQELLLDCISVALSKTSYASAKPGVAGIRTNTINNTQQLSDASGSVVQLALRTLAHFDFKGHELLEFARESVIVYLEDEDGNTRKDAAICCCRLVANSLSAKSAAHFSSSRFSRIGGAKRRRLVEEIMEELLTAAVADADVSVRKSVILSLHEDGSFDVFLAQADSLSSIFIALNDEDFHVRELAISLAGRLSEKNPAYVLPALRRRLIQLLTYLDQSMDSKSKEDSAKLLGCLIRSCERLILPYIAPIHKTLVARLSEGTGSNASSGVVIGVLATVGELAKVGGFTMRQYLPELMPLIVEALLDGASANKREVAVATLGQVVQSTGYVISPYNEYPQLLGLLLKLLNGELAWSTRREVLKVLGIMGALDPHIHKCNQHRLPGSHGEVNRAASEAGQHIVSMEELPTEIWPTFVTPEDYYSQIAISSLMRILRDPSLSSYHQKVVGSILFIFKSMGLGCVPYLPKLILYFTELHDICENQCSTYASTYQSCSPSFPNYGLLPLLYLHPTDLCKVLHLVEQLCLALNDEFRTYLSIILPCCIQVLNDAERCNDFSYVTDILRTVEVFGGTLDERMHLLLPSLIRLFKVEASVDVRCRAINTVTKLIPRVQVSGHVSSLVHHLILVLDGNNDELRRDAADALCCLAYALGEDFTKYIRMIDKLLSKHHLRHRDFDEIKRRLKRREPPILDSLSVQKLTQNVPAEVISDPLNDIESDPYEEGNEVHRQPRNHQVNDLRLRTAGEASQRSTTEDWAEWMRHFSIELLRESPMPALRTCARLAQLQPSVGRELFAAGFASCWAQMNETSQEQLVRNLKTAFSSQNIPPEILATLLNLAEFMEHDEKPLPIDTRLLGALAEKCRAFAKALHYKEMEFEAACSKKMGANPVTVVESLIHINNQLHQHEAAVGILTYSQQYLDVQLKESWYEKLQRWDDALKAYTLKSSQASSPIQNLDATLGRMRCLAALARWEELSALCREQWTAAEPAARLEMAPMAANAAWNMGEWDHMSEYVSKLDDGDESRLRMLGNTTASGDGSSNGAFFKAVLLVRREKYDEARIFVEKARKCLATELAALVLESYERAYSNMVRVQQLSELEEVIDYCTLPVVNAVADGRRELIRNMWNERIQGTKRNVEVWQALLAVRELVLPPSEDIETWLKFASLCRKSGRISQARSTLIKLLQYDPESSPENWLYHGHPQVILAYLKYQWSLGDDFKRKEAFSHLQEFTVQLALATNGHSGAPVSSGNMPNSGVPLLARAYLRLGTWKRALSPGLDDDSIQEILVSLKNATHCANDSAKAWHTWALFNTAVMSHYTLRGRPDVAAKYVVAAVTGYFYSIACASTAKGVDDSLQDILRLLTLWFNHGATSEVQMALQKGFLHVKIEMWLAVLPQIIARIHSNNRIVRELIQSLLVRIGKGHPQALMYPLLVACKSISTLRRRAALDVVDKIRQHNGVLVDQAQLVSKELIRVAILWHEMWHEALEEASRLYFGEHNIEGMLAVLEPLHAKLEEGAETIIETAFIQAYGRELQEARDCCLKYKNTGKDAELTQAWDLYYHVFRRIDKQLPSLTTLDLQARSVSPELLKCRDLELAVPGTYRADAPLVTIATFAPQLNVITSKQRPRKLTIHGSDGEDYAFLLKGHEDLRQDERVMQLFGLVNTLLENSRKTAEKDLSIQRYAVIPLSPNSGLIGWVPNCDTLHHLIREYRDARKIPLNQEHRLMLAFAPDYDHLPLIAKVEVFEHALQNTEGNDLAKVLWLKSRTSEVWLDRRTSYTRSLAVMSMVGYLLGLGDRHPSNLMLHRYSGKILHIDFGDCFEASMNREKFPEKVPFRLTRMLVKAMGVSGIEGNFRSTCENVMQVLRTNKDSVMAMMEAFVHDPLINWRLFNFNEVPQMSNYATTYVHPVVNSEECVPNKELPQPRGARERELLQAVNQLGDANEVLNERAVVVMARMSNKLTGRDFSSGSSVSGAGSSIQHAPETSNLISGDAREADHGLSVKYQVDKLIKQATSHENLCQNYMQGSTSLRRANCRAKGGAPGFKVAILGAAGGIGQPLALLMKMNPLVSVLHLYDVVNSPGVTADVSHMDTGAVVRGFLGAPQLENALVGMDLVIIPAGVPRKPGMTRDDLFKINAGIVRTLCEGVARCCPHAIVNLISNPVNSTVPIAAEVFKKAGIYDPKRLLGVTTLDVVRANTFVAEALGVDPREVNVPVVGGHSGVTILPLLSQVKPPCSFTSEEIDYLTNRIQNGGTEVVEAFAAAKFADACLRGLRGDAGIVECAFVASQVTELPFFASKVRLGRGGAEEIFPLGPLSEYERAGLDKAKRELAGSIEKGVAFTRK
ncbi:Rapamycin binding domain [Musa troglodytarum]|uniref:Serine/threonine-protein kinase TOR n=2 Tax=Magnoliopsida TaxID=3398 RepID=A0A9E7JZJ0_9LILI|nr:Rapamycin binding domain [Musa troglodytarum]